MDNSDKPKLIDRFPRTMGFIIVAISAALAKWQIYDPTHAIQLKRNTIWLSTACISLSFLCFVYGICLIFFGKKVNPWINSHTEYFTLKKPYIFIAIAALVILHIWILYQLERQGFHQSN